MSGATSTRLDFTLFGGLRAQAAGHDPVVFPPQQPGILLAYLALHLERVHTRDELACLLWPDLDPEDARPKLRQLIYAVRKQLEQAGAPEAALISTRTTVHLSESLVETDTRRFENLIASAASLGSDAHGRVRLLREAIDLYRGDLLPGFYQDSVVAERDRLAHQFRDALLLLAESLGASGDPIAGIKAARRAVALDEIHEESHRTLMRLYAASGQGAAAIRQYQDLERILQKELGACPSPEAARLVDALRRGNVGALPRVESGGLEGAGGPAIGRRPDRDHFGEANVGSSRESGRTGRRSMPLAATSAALGIVAVLAVFLWPRNEPPKKKTANDRPGALSVVWAAHYAPRPDEKDSDPVAIVANEAGDIYVAGLCQTLHNDTDFLTVKLDRNGAQRWSQRYNGPGNDLDRAKCIGLGPDGSVFVAGESDNGKGNEQTRLSGLDIALVRYDPDGRPSSAWPDVGYGVGVRRYNGPANGEDSPVAMLVQDDGAVVVLGTSWGDHGKKGVPGKEIVLLRYNPDGKCAWVCRYTGGYRDDSAAGFVRDPTGHYFLAGSASVLTRSGPEADILVARVSAAGKFEWVRRWGEDNRLDDVGRGIALDRAGDVLVVGTGRGLPGYFNANRNGFVEVKYDSKGNLCWNRGAAAASETLDRIDATLNGSDGSMVVSGQHRTPDMSVYVGAVERDSQGTLLMTTDPSMVRDDWALAGDDGPGGLAWGVGHIYLCGGIRRSGKMGTDAFVCELDRKGVVQREWTSNLPAGVHSARAITTYHFQPIVATQINGPVRRNMVIYQLR